MKRIRWKWVARAVAIALLLGAAALGGRTLTLEQRQAHALVNAGRAARDRGDISGAHLKFVQATLLAPRAAFVRAALADVPAVHARTALDRAASWLAPREWAFLLVAFGWAAGLSWALVIASNSKRRASRRLAVAGTALFALSGLGFARTTTLSRQLAVVTERSGLLVSPYDGAGARADLAPGSVVSVDARYGGYARVDSVGEASGWVASSALRPIVGS